MLIEIKRNQLIKPFNQARFLEKETKIFTFYFMLFYWSTGSGAAGLTR